MKEAHRTVTLPGMILNLVPFHQKLAALKAKVHCITLQRLQPH